MFTGIVEGQARLERRSNSGTNVHFYFCWEKAGELHLDQSLAHRGVCLTVDELVGGDVYRVTAVQETLDRSNLGLLSEGDLVNLERCMPAGGRLDGHIVQGHVDTKGKVEKIEALDGSHKVWVRHAPEAGMTVEKGSICVDGVSLTIVDSEKDRFSVVVIPYTWEHTGFHRIKPGEAVNLEFDILGKYIQQYLNRTQQSR